MSGRRVLKSLQAVAAHGFLFCFTLLLVLKLDAPISFSWWKVFVPLWLFHVTVARGRFSLPAPSVPHDRHWAPFHAVMATPMLVAFELLLCIYLERRHAVSLKIVFLPLIAFEASILVDNIRMCRALMPGDDETFTDEAVWETLPHFWVAISMVFLLAATIFTLLKLCGDVAALGWWDLFINYGVAQCFAFLTCTKWHNPIIHRRFRAERAGSSPTTFRFSSSNSGLLSSSSSTTFRYPSWNSSLLLSSGEDLQRNRFCSLQDIGGHVMKVPIICFQILLFMHLAGTPASARHIPKPVLFSPLLLLQGAGVLFALYRSLEKLILWLRSETFTGTYSRISSSVQDCMAFMHHGSRFLGWWSIDEGSREEQARLYSAGVSGYNTFSPESVKKKPKAELVDEIWRLQAALSEQTEITKFNQQEYDRLQNEKILCRICFDEQISIVLLPCRHHILCSVCCERCERCPICRVYIEERLHISNV